MTGLKIKVINCTRETVLGKHIQHANTFFQRLIGLLFKKELRPEEGLLIYPCRSIHTLGMRFSMDVLYLDSRMRVEKLYPNVKPQRFLCPSWKAIMVLELPLGQIAQTGTKVGDQLKTTINCLYTENQ